MQVQRRDDFTGRLDSWKMLSFTSERWESSSLPSHLVNTWDLWGMEDAHHCKLYYFFHGG